MILQHIEVRELVRYFSGKSFGP